MLVNRTTGRILDGHLRVDMAAQNGDVVPVDYVELTEAEERLVLATFDPIGNMAGIDTDALAELTDGLNVGPDLADLLGSLLPDGDDDDDERAQPLRTIELAPMDRVFVLITVPLNDWADVGPILDQLALNENITIQNSVK